MIIYTYKVRRTELADDQLKSLGRGDDVVSGYSPREFKEKYECADCTFPNGDTYPLEGKALELDTVTAEEV